RGNSFDAKRPMPAKEDVTTGHEGRQVREENNENQTRSAETTPRVARSARARSSCMTCLRQTYARMPGGIFDTEVGREITRGVSSVTPRRCLPGRPRVEFIIRPFASLATFAVKLSRAFLGVLGGEALAAFHSALMLASFTTRVHFAISDLM